MALKEQDIVIVEQDANGDKVLQFPMTRAANVEDLHKVAMTGKYGDLTGTPTALKNPNALELLLRGATLGTYDGSAKLQLNITQSKLIISVNGVKVAEYDGGSEQTIDLQIPTWAYPGFMIPYGGRTVPPGYLLCNGANVSRTEYADLFASIGTYWGAGDGSTTFSLPNMNGRFIEGTTNISNVGKYVDAGLPNITGKAPNMAWKSYVTQTAEGAFFVTQDGIGSNTNDATNKLCLNLDASRVSSILGKALTVQPASAYALMIIKV